MLLLGTLHMKVHRISHSKTAADAGSMPHANASRNIKDTCAMCAGLALGAALMQLPWRVHGICLAGDAEYYASQQYRLVQAFCGQHAPDDLHPGAWSMDASWHCGIVAAIIILGRSHVRRLLHWLQP